MKRLLLTILIAGLMLTGCGRNISKEKDALFETVSMEESGAVTSKSIQQDAEASEETMESSEQEETKENDGDKGEPEETAPTASKQEESEPSAVSSPKPTKTPAATAKPAKEPEAGKPTATAKPTAASEPAQAPVAANTPEPAKAPEQTPTPAQTHTHTYVEETTPATCTEAAVVTTKCSSCGEVSGTRTEGSALGHDFEYIVYSSPSCSSDGYGYNQCKRCRLQQDYETLAKLPHDYEVTVISEGDCKSPKVTQKICKVCGSYAPLEEDWDAHKDDHVWVTETGQVWSDEAFAMVDVQRTVCAVCNKEKPD